MHTMADHPNGQPQFKWSMTPAQRQVIDNQTPAQTKGESQDINPVPESKQNTQITMPSNQGSSKQIQDLNASPGE